MTALARPAHRTRIAAGVLTGLVAVTGLAACSGGSEDSVSKNDKLDTDDDGSVTPEEVLAAARTQLEATSGVTVTLATDEDPGVDFLSEATGTIIADPPAFEGTVSGRVSGFDAASVDVVSVDGKLWVKVPLIGWTDQYQPAELCAPDPALLLDPETGVGNVLTSTTDLEEGDTERGGTDNKDILTTFSGTAPGDAIREILPCAEADSFPVNYKVDKDGKLVSVDMTGAFFPDSEEVTYTIGISAYDVTRDISAPQ